MGRDNFTLCISCIEEDLGQQMVATCKLMDEEGYINFQFEAILDILERQLWSWACMKHCDRLGGLRYEDAIWREDFCCSIHFWSFLRASNVLVGITVIFPILHKIIGILEFLMLLIN